MNNDFEFNKETFQTAQPQKKYVTYIPYGLTPETYEERKEIRKLGNIIGGALLFMTVISIIFGFVMRIVLISLGLWGTKEVAILSDPATLQLLQVILSTIMFTFPFVFLFSTNGYTISKLIKFKKPKKEDILPYLLFGIAFCAFANITVSIIGNFFASFGIEYNVDFGEKPQGIFGFMLTFIATAIVPALVEEFACRGIILGSLRKYGDGFAVICSAILFGLMHGNFQQIPFAFLVGIALGYIVVKTNTIWIAVVVHFFNNAVSVVFQYLTQNISEMSQNIIFTIYLLGCLLLSVVSIYLLRDREYAYKIKTAKTYSNKKQIYKWFFSAPTIIIFIVVCLLEALTFFS